MNGEVHLGKSFHVISHLVQNDIITFDTVTLLNGRYLPFFKSYIKVQNI